MLGSLEPLPDVPAPLSRSLCGAGAGALLARLAGPPGLAAFDADGTIWDGDIGEEVLKALIAEEQLIDPPADPWGAYDSLVKRDPAEGFTFTGRVMRGLSETRLRELSARVFAQIIEAQVFPEVLEPPKGGAFAFHGDGVIGWLHRL